MITTQTSPTMPPWLGLWISPRKTIRRILDTNPTYGVTLLAMLWGVVNALDNSSRRNSADTLPLLLILLMCFLIGPIGGIISLKIFAALYRWTGSWIGGQANYVEMQTALAWSFLPQVLTLVVWVFNLLVFGEEAFSAATSRLDAYPFLVVPLFGMIAVNMVLTVWSLFLMIKTTAEAHRFSAWKGLTTIVLGTLVLVGPIVLIALLIGRL